MAALSVIPITAEHFLPDQCGRNPAPFPMPNILYFSQFHHNFSKQNEEKKCHKKKKKNTKRKRSVDLNVPIDHAVSVTTCSCKRLLIILVTSYAYWRYWISVIRLGPKTMCAHTKNTKIMLVNLALLWQTNQIIGLKRLCFWNCKQSSCHTQCLLTANITQKNKYTGCRLLLESLIILFQLS